MSRLLGVGVIAALLTVGLTGCIPSEAGATSCDLAAAQAPAEINAGVAIVAAPTSSFVDMADAVSASQSLIASTFPTSNTQYSLVVADGAPGLKAVRYVEFQTDLDLDKQRQWQYVAGDINLVSDCASGLNANAWSMAPESDLLAAMRVGGDSLAQIPAGAARSMIVYGNGLQTAGQASFLDGGIPDPTQISAIVTKLKSAGALPDLAGVTVNFVGIGVVSGDQPELNTQSVRALKQFWSEVVLAAGGTVGEFIDTVTDGSPAGTPISVSPVSALANACVNTTLGTEDGFNFAADSATFLDLAAAQAGAGAVAADIDAAGCTDPVTVIGYVSAGVNRDAYVWGNAADAALSLARAEAFKQLLVDAGVNVPIVATGGGKGPFNDWDAAGVYLESQGQANRQVVISQ